jgi:hypothetical protein
VVVDFGVTKVVDGNWGVHAVIKKGPFAGRRGGIAEGRSKSDGRASRLIEVRPSHDRQQVWRRPP